MRDDKKLLMKAKSPKETKRKLGEHYGEFWNKMYPFAFKLWFQYSLKFK